MSGDNPYAIKDAVMQFCKGHSQLDQTLELIREQRHTINNVIDGWTALRELICNGMKDNDEMWRNDAEKKRLPVLQALLDAGADQTIVSNGGHMPIHDAAQFGRFLFAEALVKHHAAPHNLINAATPLANLKQTGTGNNTPMHFAAVADNKAIFDFLITLGGTPNEPRSQQGYTPMEKLQSELRRAGVCSSTASETSTHGNWSTRGRGRSSNAERW